MNPVLRYEYSFKFKDGRQFSFNLIFDSVTLRQVHEGQEGVAPRWTALDFYKCPNCTLDQASSPNCPLAVCLVPIIDAFRTLFSYEEVEVRVKTAERTMSAVLPLQKGLSALLGVSMPTSGCPVMEKLAPMARFHLPFASVEETVYRSVSMYLLAQFFIQTEGGKPDYGLEGLRAMYQEIEKANKALCERLSHISDRDANVNAVIVLDCFAKNMDFLLLKSIQSLKHLFSSYLSGQSAEPPL